MKFKNPRDVRTVVQLMRDNDIKDHSFNRARINELFDGWPPFNQEEAEESHINTNLNFLEPAGLAQKARSTWNNAFLKTGRYFSVNLDAKPVHKKDQWAASISNRINKAMKSGRKALRYIESIRATGAQVILHGIGPKEWVKGKSWCPGEVGIQDLLIPSNARVNMENLSRTAIYRSYTPEQLFRDTHCKNVDPGWKMSTVNAALKWGYDQLAQPQGSYENRLNPERLERLYKANSGVLDTDAVPTINCWDFLYQDENDEKGRWYRKMIIDDATHPGLSASGMGDFIYDSRRPYASNLSQILHFQFGDGANTAPFLYHSVRSLGFLLYGVCHLQNRLRCRFTDAVFEATLQYFRAFNDEDRARIQKVDLFHLGFIPSGIEMVKSQDRWQVPGDLVGAALSQNRQLMSENASSFIQDVDQGTQKELTATEVMARLNNANALVSALLSMAYTYAKFEYQEIARRFTLKDSQDPDIVAFRLGCLRDGVPEQYLNVERWEIEPERVMGGGNKTLELAQSKALMEVRAAYDPDAQRSILRDYTLAVTDDPAKALNYVPDETQAVSPAAHDAQLAAGALMNGAPVAVRMGIDHVTYVDSMLASMKYLIEDIQAIGGPMPQQLIGLVSIYKHLQGHIAIIAQNPEEKQRVKMYQDTLQNFMNIVKAWGQQMDEAHQATQEQNGDGGKMAATVIQAQSKAKIDEASAVAKERRNNAKFVQEQKRKNVQMAAELQRKATLTQAEVEATDMKTAADLRAKQAAASEPDTTTE